MCKFISFLCFIFISFSPAKADSLSSSEACYGKSSVQAWTESTGYIRDPEEKEYYREYKERKLFHPQDWQIPHLEIKEYK